MCCQAFIEASEAKDGPKSFADDKLEELGYKIVMEGGRPSLVKIE